nr:metallophosphoesterase [Candidatus Sigynarchaeota archaeon]
MARDPSKQHMAYWKPVAVILAACTGLSIYFSAWVFIGGFWIWWASGFAAGSEIAAYRPLIYAAWIFLFTCLGLDAYAVIKLCKVRGKGHHRFANVSSIIILVASFTAFVNLGGGSVQTQSTPLIVLPGGDPSTRAVIACFTPAMQQNLVLEYTLDGSATTVQAFDSGDGTSHRFCLEALLPNSTYEYHLIANSSSSQTVPSGMDQARFFKTAPRNSTGGITFLSISDMHSWFPADLASKMTSERPDFIVEAGDLTGMGSDSSDWSRYFQATGILYDGSSASTPAALRLPVIGNHDGLFFGRNNFGIFFYGIGNGSDSPFWYRVDAGDVHFIMLDVEWGLETFIKVQEDWLQQTLASINPADFIIVTTHCPVYSSGNNGEITGVAAKLAPIFEGGGVDLV